MSYTFGEDVVKFMVEKFKLDLICRAHQVVEDGYEFFGKRSLVTIFSAPNYIGEFDNSAGIMTVNESLVCSFQVLKPREVQGNTSSTIGRPGTPAPKDL